MAELILIELDKSDVAAAARRVIRHLVAVVVMGALLVAPAVVDAEQVKPPYLSQSFKIPAYKAAFADLFRGERNLPPWLLAYLKNRNGVEIPGRLEGSSY